MHTNKILILILVLVSFSSIAKNKEKEKYEEDTVLAKKIDSLIEAKNFILSSEYLTTKEGRTYEVENNKNFIKIAEGKADIQLSTFGGGKWYTFDGDIENWELKKKTKKNNTYYEVYFRLNTGKGYIDIYLWSSSSSDTYAVLHGISFSGVITYHGKIIEPGSIKLSRNIK